MPPGQAILLSLGDINNHHQPSTAMFFEVVILRVVRNMTVNQPFSGAVKPHVVVVGGQEEEHEAASVAARLR
jgi:hypothetical protein